MYEGWLRLGGREVVNMPRLMAYVGNGIVPPGVSIEDCTGTCDGFAEVMTENGYNTPRVDLPDWFDAADPDSLEFAGFMPTEVTGLDGSQATRGMLARLDGGSLPGRVARAGREIGVTGVLVASSTCGAEYGLRWLNGLLWGSCDDDCFGRPLHALTCCPTPACGGVTDPLAQLVSETFPHDSGDWIARGGVFTEPTGEFRVNAADSPQVVNRNRLVNPAVSGDIEGWLAGANTSIAYVAEPTWAGQGSIAATMTAESGNINVNVPSSDRFDVTAGEHLAVMNHVQGADVERRARLGLWAADATGTSLGTQYLPWMQVPVAANPDDFTELAGVLEVPEGAVKGSLITIAETPVTGETWHVDGGMVADAEQATDGTWIPPAYFDGDTLDPTGEFRYAWEGERNNSPSVKIRRVTDASTTTREVPVTVARDSFVRSSFAQPGPTGHVWHTLAGAWENTGGETDGDARITALTSGLALAQWEVALPWQRYSVTVQPVAKNPGRRGLVWGLVDADTFNYAWVSAAGVDVGRVEGGVDTILEQYPAAVGGPVLITVESLRADPDRVRVGLNGVEVDVTTVPGSDVRTVGIGGDKVGGSVADTMLVDVVPGQPVPDVTDAWVAGPTQEPFDTGARITWDVRLFDQVSLGDNILPNGDFEDTSGTVLGENIVLNGDAEAGVEHWASPTVVPVQDTGVYQEGTASVTTTDGSALYVGAVAVVEVDPDTGEETITGVVTDHSIPVQPGVEYVGQGWVRTDVDAAVTTGIMWWSADDQPVGETVSLLAADVAGGAWTQAGAEEGASAVFVPEEAAYATLVVAPDPDGTPPGQLWADGMGLRRVTRTAPSWAGFVADPEGRSCAGAVAALVSAETWDEQDPAITWDSVDPALTWDEYGADPLVSDPVAVEVAGVYRVGWQVSTTEEWDATQEAPPVIVEGRNTETGTWVALASATPPAGAACVEQSVTVAVPAGFDALRVVFEPREVGYAVDVVTIRPQQGVNLPMWVLPAIVDTETQQIVRTAAEPSVVDTTTSELVVWDLLGVNLAPTWRPALLVPYPGLWIESVTIEHFPVLSAAECVDGYLRTYPGVVCTSGPTVTETQVTGCGTKLLTVEWVWTASDSYRYGMPRSIVSGATNDVNAGDPTVGSGVQVVYDGVIGSKSWDCSAKSTPDSCAADPGNPGMVDPPRPVLVADPNRVSISNDPVESLRMFIPAAQMEAGDGVFTFRLANDQRDKVGVRVRVYDDVTATGDPVSVCNFATEFQIDYLAPDRRLTIDGVSGAATVDCPDGQEDASAVIHGAFGGPVERPVAACGRNYLVVVQWLDTYPKSVQGYYIRGEDTGAMTLDVLIAGREG